MSEHRGHFNWKELIYSSAKQSRMCVPALGSHQIRPRISLLRTLYDPFGSKLEACLPSPEEKYSEAKKRRNLLQNVQPLAVLFDRSGTQNTHSEFVHSPSYQLHPNSKFQLSRTWAGGAVSADLSRQGCQDRGLQHQPRSRAHRPVPTTRLLPGQLKKKRK